MKLASTIAGLTLAVAAVYSAPADAQYHAIASQPAARCQSALPVFDTNIRKRPLSVQNEGSASSYVTCGFEFDAFTAVNNSAVLVDTYFYNNTDDTVTVTCSGVTGWNGGDNEYVAFSIDVPSRSTDPEDGNLYWLDTDFEGGGMETSLVAISCLLPPGVGINDTYIWSEAAE